MTQPTFKSTGIVAFNRTEIKPMRNWWQRFLHWWRDDIDIPLYQYELEMHTDNMDIQKSDIVITEFDDVRLFVVWALTTVKMKTAAPTDKWLIYSDFKKTTYAVVGRSFKEGHN